MQTQAMHYMGPCSISIPHVSYGVPVAREHQVGQFTYPEKGALNLDLKTAFNNSSQK